MLFKIVTYSVGFLVGNFLVYGLLGTGLMWPAFFLCVFLLVIAIRDFIRNRLDK
jgi:hypothetical protein